MHFEPVLNVDFIGFVFLQTQVMAIVVGQEVVSK